MRDGTDFIIDAIALHDHIGDALQPVFANPVAGGDFVVDAIALHDHVGDALRPISTQAGDDFIVDAIALHDHIGDALRPVFANPAVTKLFHGADSDVLWLQRDFHIYTVNLFDTARACSVLNKPYRSLAFLLDHYCHVSTDKRLQLADWRRRPLPPAMLQYARTDSHYLPYIASQLRWELVQADTGGEGGAGASANGKGEKAAGGGAAVAAAAAGAGGGGRRGSRAGHSSGSKYEEAVRRSNALCLQLYEKPGERSAGAADRGAVGEAVRERRERGEVIGGSAEAAAAAAATLFRQLLGFCGYVGGAALSGGPSGDSAGSGAASAAPDAAATSAGQTTSDRSQVLREVRAVLDAVTRWRDTVAREEDESLRFLLADVAVVAVALLRPATCQELIGCVGKAMAAAAALTPPSMREEAGVPRPIQGGGSGGEAGTLEPTEGVTSSAVAEQQATPSQPASPSPSPPLVRRSPELVALITATCRDVRGGNEGVHGTAGAAEPNSTAAAVNGGAERAVAAAAAVIGGTERAVAVAAAAQARLAEISFLLAPVVIQQRAPAAMQEAWLEEAVALTAAAAVSGNLSAAAAAAASAAGAGAAASGSSAEEGGILPSDSSHQHPNHPHTHHTHPHHPHHHRPHQNFRLPKRWQRARDPNQARANFIKKFSCQGPVYENCRIYSGDGRLLCFCDKRKLEWYVGRGLAEYVTVDMLPSLQGAEETGLGAKGEAEVGSAAADDDGSDAAAAATDDVATEAAVAAATDDAVAAAEGATAEGATAEGATAAAIADSTAPTATDLPPTPLPPNLASPLSVRLLFQPKGRPEDDENEFYIQSKSNRCVSCGESTHYLRYRLVPSCYRHAFPEHLKSHRSHDIVLLCVDCHDLAHRAAEIFKREVARRFGVPLLLSPLDRRFRGGSGESGGEEGGEGAGEGESVVGGGAGREKGEGGEKEGGGEMESEGSVSGERKGGRDARVEAAFLLNDAARSAVAVLRHGASLPESRLCELLLPVWKVLKRAAGSPVKIEELEMVVQAGKGTRVRAGKRKGLPVVGQREVLQKALASLGGGGGGEGGEREGNEVKGVDAGASEGVSEKESEGVSDQSGKTEEEVTLGLAAPDLTSLNLSATPTIEPVPLRGHWEHGTKVVALLLAGGGEAGIREFTQQWREVFVAALQPRFLPPGWDVQHLGRRQFGEFSVYNPQRRRYVQGEEGGGEGEEGGRGGEEV
ncbi:unnamed protein product [Closterium sp. NIES-53]